MRPRSIPVLLLAAAAAFAATAAAADEPEGPGVYRNGEKLMEIRGGIEDGYRWVSDREGRYDQDLNLRSGYRIVSANLRGDGLVDGLAVQTFSADLVGVGDPYTAFDLRAQLPETYRLHVHADRDAAVFRGGYDPHPFDTVRGSAVGRLDFRPRKDLEIHLSTERRTREGDANLDHLYRPDRTLPVAADIRYDGRFHSAGFDATPGRWRFGATATTGSAVDESFRSLDRPGTPVPELGTYRTRSDIRSADLSGRAGVRLFGGRLDLGVLGGWSGAETDSSLRERAVVVQDGADDMPGTADDFAMSTESRARTEANSRALWARVEALALLGRDGEVLARWETRDASSRGAADLFIREQTPPFNDPTEPFTPVPLRTTLEARQDRALLEGRWRASKAWRLRAGAERIEERFRVEDPDPGRDAWDPGTTALLAGFDWTPSDRVDLSVLGRGSRTGGSSTRISAEEAEALSARLRLKRPDGWRMTAFAHLKSREKGSTESEASVDAYGLTFGREAGKDGWLDLSLTRHDFSLASDTRFVVDSMVNNLKQAHRVTYDEEVTAATLDFSVPVSGPLRAFASARAALARGDLPYRQHDAALGLGWRVAKDWEVKLEGRRVAYREDDRDYDDYGVTLVMLSVLWEF